MALAEKIAAQPARQRAQTAGSAITLARIAVPLPVILYVLAVMLPVGFQVGPLALSFLRVFLLVMTVPLMLMVLGGRFGRVFATDILFTAHILWAAVALAVNSPDRMVEQIGSVGIEFLGGYAVGRAYIRTPESFLALCRFLAVMVFMVFPFVLFETLTGRSLLLEAIWKLPGVQGQAINNHQGRLGLERVQMTFAHPIHWGLFCVVAFCLSFVALKDLGSNTWRYVSSAVIALSGFLALSSGALLALALQLGLIGWSLALARITWRWWLAFGLFWVAYIVIDLLSNRTPIQIFMSYATFSPFTAYLRSIIFDYGVANVIGSAEKGIVGSPLFGIGLNDWVRPSYMHSGSMDNFWLVMAVRYGIPGFLTVVLGYGLAIFHIMRRRFDPDTVLSQFRKAWVFTFLGLSFTLCTVHVWTNIYSFVFFMFGAGMWLITAEPGAGDARTSTPGDARTTGASDRPSTVYTRFAHSTEAREKRQAAGTRTWTAPARDRTVANLPRRGRG